MIVFLGAELFCWGGRPGGLSVYWPPSTAASVRPRVRIPPWRDFEFICKKKMNKTNEKDQLLRAPLAWVSTAVGRESTGEERAE